MVSDKSCPYCGGQDFTVKPLWNGKYRFVACNKCKSAGPIAPTEEKAIELFNTRVERTCEVVGSVKIMAGSGKSIPGYALSCGHVAGNCVPDYCSACGAKVIAPKIGEQLGLFQEGR